MPGPPLKITMAHLPTFLLIATPVFVSVTGAGVLPTVALLTLVLFLSIGLNLKSLSDPGRYQLESLAVSHFVEVCCRYVTPQLRFAR
jgi:hypothetical protein